MKIRNYIITALIIVSPSIAFAQTVNNPRLYIEANATTVSPNSDITATIRLDSPKPVNAIEIELSYQSDILKPTVFNDGGTIIDLWQKKDWSKTPGKINFVGGILRSYSGAGGKIAKITFKALKEGKAQISYGPVNIYYADGKGTKAVVNSEVLNLFVSTTAPKSEDDIAGVQTSPKFEFSQTVKNPNDKNYLAVFNAKDDGSGIKMFKMRTMRWLSYGDWYEVTNPVAIPSGVWKYQIEAISNSNASTIETFYINSEIFVKIACLLAGLVFIIGLVRYIIKKCNHIAKNSLF